MKVKLFNFKSIVTYVTIAAFYWATTLSAIAAPLPPISLAQMYSLAAQGNVRALRAAIQRGMNIDATDRYGNTGLCHSIYQRNYTAYNAFHAAGANPRHPCIQNIPTQQYDYFMASSRATPVTATPRDAYKEFADGEFIFSTTTWVIGGILLAGGIAALAFSGGGGGGHHYYFPTNDTFTPTEDSLGALVGTATPNYPVSSPYVPVKFKEGINNSDFTLDNDSQILINGEQKNLSDVINFQNSVLEYTPYLQVAMKAVNGKEVVNGQAPLTGSDVGTTITLNNNTIGLAALHNADAINNNTLKIIAENGTIGMVGSDNSMIQNAGNIDISFQGTASTDQVIGMYVDTSSSAVNTGTIIGNVTSGSSAGSLIGMEGRLINQIKNPSSSIPAQLNNNGTIELSATAAPNQTISNSLIGMATYLENVFLVGSKLVRRTGNIDMTNNGEISLNVNLSDTGSYDTSQVNLFNGTGGIIGMRSDAHTNAINNKSINITITPENANSVTNAHAGMLSVHGGMITNNQSILVDGGIGGFGMLGIRGEGTNSEFNTLNPTLVNNGSIEVNSVDGIGMATRHGGSVKNSGNILMGENSTGLQVNAGTGLNSGSITLSNSGIGMAIVKNTTAEEGTVNNTSSASITNAQSGGKTGTITIENANGASGMFIEDGTAINQGTIEINGTASSTTTVSSYGIQAENGTVNNSGAINMDVLMSGDANSYGIYGENATIVNNSGSINFDQQGIGSYTASGANTNSGSITMNAVNSIGMSSDSGAISNTNTGNITVASGTGIQSNTGQVSNQGVVNITNGTNSIGITSGTSVINGAFDNTDASITMTGANSTGILLGENGTATNWGKITLESTKNGLENYGIKSEGGTNTIINNQGNILLNGYSYDPSQELGYGISIVSGEANNNGTINLTNTYGYGMSSTDGTINNNSTITLSSGGYGLQSESGEVFNNEGATITITGTPTLNSSYGIAIVNGTAKNFGTINVTGSVSSDESYGIYADGGNGINHSTINMNSDNAYGLYDNANGQITNTDGDATTAEINLYGNNSTGMFTNSGKAENYGIINVGVRTDGSVSGGNNSVGMEVANSGGNAFNFGTINLNGTSSTGMLASGGNAYNYSSMTVASEGSKGMASSGDGQAINQSSIDVLADTGIGMFADGGTATNNATISVSGTNGIGMSASSSSNTAIVVNGVNGLIEVSGTNGIGMYADGTAAQAINLGTINVTTTSSSAYGMKAVNGGSIENAGKIIMAAGSQGTGIYIGTNSTLYNNASGVIEFEGGASYTGAITGDPETGEVSICESGGSCNNKFIYMEQGAILENSGTLITNTSLNLNEIGRGKLILTSTGKINAGDEITGDLYVQSDSSMLKQGQLNTYYNLGALNANSIKANVISSSPMWDVSTQDSNTPNTDSTLDSSGDNNNSSQEKDIVYNRVAFNNIVANTSQASYLEANYAIRNSIYDGMILASNQEEFDRAVAEGLGTDLIPNFAKQNLDIMRNVNHQINSAVFNNTDVAETRTTVGYDFFAREQDGYDGLSGYEDEAHTGYALFDHKYNENFRYGIGASFTKYESDYDNGSERDEVIAQIMAPLLFEIGNTQFLSMPKIGMGWGEYTRKTQGKEYKADTKNYYYGINNELRHDVDMGIVTLEPVAEFNVLGLYQNRTKENIRVESNNNVSVEGGLGLYAKKSFSLTDEDELKIRLGGTYYHEFNNPYQAPKAGVVGLLGTYHMNSYDAQKDRAVLSVRFDYKRGKFNFYLEGNSYVEDDDTYSINAGLTYAF